MIEEIVDILKKTDAYDIVVYNTIGYSPFYDYVVICTVQSQRQGNAAVNYLKKEDIEGCELRSVPRESSSNWHLIDLTSVVVHIFDKEGRNTYNLDGLFSHLPSKIY